jgi:hypothetical protein
MRKTKIVQITDGSADEKAPDYNRDHGKCFLLTEMASRPAEKWGVKFFTALGRAGVEVPPEIMRLGVIGVLFVGIKMLGSMRSEDADPLIDEMMTCVKVMPNQAHPEIARALVDLGQEGDDIEEITTRLKLRNEVFVLHVGFTPADVVSKLAEIASATVTSLNTQTSSNQSE